MTARPALAALLLLAAAPAAARPLAPSPEVSALRAEIAALQVDQALALTPDQARALLPVLQQAAAQVQAFRARVDSAEPALVAALTRARDELRAGGPISPGTAQAIGDARRSAMAPDRDAGKALRAQAAAILTPAQLQALRSVPLGAGPGLPGGKAKMEGAGPGRGGGRQLLMLGVITSDPFLALVAARAR
ncbi:MAG: hypothetical protein WCS72_17305 [Deltaproteobacteria bacterium]